ncbi:hypothetical protein LV779_34905 [Streptomyces thinghirensis]|nr:hypothetical protein [Streptomyces thinghirensis]
MNSVTGWARADPLPGGTAHRPARPSEGSGRPDPLHENGGCPRRRPHRLRIASTGTPYSARRPPSRSQVAPATREAPPTSAPWTTSRPRAPATSTSACPTPCCRARQQPPAALAAGPDRAECELPFQDGRDTGHASWRTTTWGAGPSPARPRHFESPAHFDDLVDTLLEAGGAHRSRRPVPGHPPLPPPAHHRSPRRRRRPDPPTTPFCSPPSYAP